MPIQEKKLIRLSMIVLLLSLLMVYLLLFQIKGDELKNTWEEKTDITKQITTSLSWEETTIMPLDDELVLLENKGKTTISDIETSWEEDATENNESDTTSLSNIHMLSGTKLFYGKIEGIEKLGILYQYALLDSTGTFFINIDNTKYNFEDIARALGWNLYKMTTEEELAINKLFGDKVVYVNIPEYKEKIVLMLIYIDDELRLLQIDYQIYHSSKTYIKSLFID